MPAVRRIAIPHQFDPSTRPFQLDVLSNSARFKFLRIHRKAGKTGLASNKLIIKCLKQRGIAWYVAPTYSQGKEIMWRDPEMLFKYIPKEILSGVPNKSELTVPFVSGSILGIKGADDPDRLRGPNPMIVILDEVYLMKPQIWTEILMPIAMVNQQMEVWFVGTPKPLGRFWMDLRKKFRREMEAGNPEYFELTLTAEESGILSPEALAQAKREMTQAAFEQEMMCVEHDSDGVVFRGVERCIIDRDYRESDADMRCPHKFGVDLARLQDWTVMIGVNRTTHTVDFFDRYNQIDWQLQKARIEATCRRFNNATTDIDSTGVGDPVVEDLSKRGLNVRGVTLSSATKSNLITNLALMIEQGKIRFPRIPELIEELQMYGYEVTKSGHTRYSAPDGRHDDCVMALALAAWELGSRLSPQNAIGGGSAPRAPRTSFS